MPRQFDSDRLVLATHNQGKLAEFRDLLQPLGITVLSSAELDLPEPVEDGLTFEANALLKATSATERSGLPCLADDSGLEVFGLDGNPGIYSARWAGEGGDFSLAMARVRNELIQRFGCFAQADKRARFVATLCLMWPDGHHEFIEGETFGQLVDPPRGHGGFGYDPMFQPDGHSQTFGEMPAALKSRLSHRAKATNCLMMRCFGVGRDQTSGQVSEH